MIWLLFGLVVGIVVKVLAPMPVLDEKVRAGWRWVAQKIP